MNPQFRAEATALAIREQGISQAEAEAGIIGPEVGYGLMRITLGEDVAKWLAMASPAAIGEYAHLGLIAMFATIRNPDWARRIKGIFEDCPPGVLSQLCEQADRLATQEVVFEEITA